MSTARKEYEAGLHKNCERKGDKMRKSCDELSSTGARNCINDMGIVINSFKFLIHQFFSNLFSRDSSSTSHKVLFFPSFLSKTD